jgi:hypothetical protein
VTYNGPQNAILSIVADTLCGALAAGRGLAREANMPGGAVTGHRTDRGVSYHANDSEWFTRGNVDVDTSPCTVDHSGDAGESESLP